METAKKPPYTFPVANRNTKCLIRVWLQVIIFPGYHKKRVHLWNLATFPSILCASQSETLLYLTSALPQSWVVKPHHHYNSLPWDHPTHSRKVSSCILGLRIFFGAFKLGGSHGTKGSTVTWRRWSTSAKSTKSQLPYPRSGTIKKVIKNMQNSQNTQKRIVWSSVFLPFSAGLPTKLSTTSNSDRV